VGGWGFSRAEETVECEFVAFLISPSTSTWIHGQYRRLRYIHGEHTFEVQGGESLRPGVLNLHLLKGLKGHVLMAERFAGRIYVSQRKVCILLQDMPTDISLRKDT
jgi:hypothetical protein